MKRQRLTVQGIVQGVGFRPFIFSLAQRFALGGWVKNDGQGVVIEVEGDERSLDAFKTSLTTEKPPLAILLQVTVQDIAVTKATEFTILASEDTNDKIALISPDVAICRACEQELNDPRDRRYHYSFINCTHCGPRYTIIRDIPYDRPLTTMSDFPMCPRCQAEYDDPHSRRFHAQPNACPDCGPTYRLTDNHGRELASESALLWEQTRALLQQEALLAVKGIGGYHICCDARLERAVAKLRAKKFRQGKPLAVMAGSLAAVKAVCFVNSEEEALLTSRARPIVLLKKRPEAGKILASLVAPDNEYLGVMLPYGPFHYLLLAKDDLLVMTSGNKSEEPLAYDDAVAQEKLALLADFFLIHNREIFRPVDDSVMRLVRHKPSFIRRSRGYVPLPLLLAWELPPVLGAGGEQKNTFCLIRGRQAFMSAHIGDLENEATYQHYCANIMHLSRLTHMEPELAAYDLHPRYFSTQYVATLSGPKTAVQHHHAHIASVMAEHGLDEPIIGVAFDGTGYGADGKLWGGEFLIASLTEYQRVAHFAYIPLPGGGKAIAEPWRLGLWALRQIYGDAFTTLDLALVQALPSGFELVLQAVDNKLQAPLTSSVGRLFDMAASLLGLRFTTHYEGQAAVELEQLAAKGRGRLLPYRVSTRKELDFLPTMAALTEGLLAGESQADLAASFQLTLAQAAVDQVIAISRDHKLTKVALSGGVFQNIFLLEYMIEKLETQGLQVYWNQQVPANDGGLALGQAVIAGMRRVRGCV